MRLDLSGAVSGVVHDECALLLLFLYHVRHVEISKDTEQNSTDPSYAQIDLGTSYDIRLKLCIMQASKM